MLHDRTLSQICNGDCHFVVQVFPEVSRGIPFANNPERTAACQPSANWWEVNGGQGSAVPVRHGPPTTCPIMLLHLNGLSTGICSPFRFENIRRLTHSVFLRYYGQVQVQRMLNVVAGTAPKTVAGPDLLYHSLLRTTWCCATYFGLQLN